MRGDDAVPGRGRADPRRRDRVGPLPLPRRRRPDPPPRCPPLLQAPRARARGRRKTLDDGLAFAARACAACAVTNGVAYAHACEEALGLAPTPSSRARARSCSSSSALWRHLNDIAAVCAGVGLAAGNNRFAALTERARRLNAPLTGHRFLFGSVRGRRQRARRSTRDDVARRARRARRDPRRARARLARAALQRLVPGPAARHRHRRPRRRARARGRRACGARSRRRRRTRAPTSPRLAYDGFAPVAPERAGRGRPGTTRAARARAPADLRAARAPARPAASRPPRPSPAAPSATIGVGRVESPRGATTCVVERAATASSGFACAPARTRTGPSVAHAAVGQPAARLPADQQELRALLRLRGPLMLTLLRDLRRLRRDLALAAPRPRPQPRDPPRRRRLVQRLRARADTRLEPVLRPAAFRPRHRRLSAPRRRSARHRRRHDPHARAAPRRLQRDAGAAPRRRARRLRPRLRHPRHRRRTSSGRSRQSSRSTCASRAARRRRMRSPQRCSS